MNRTEALDAVRDIVFEVLAVAPEDVSEESRFLDDLGADSLDLVEIVSAVEDRLGVAIPQRSLDGIRTVGDALDLALQPAG